MKKIIFVLCSITLITFAFIFYYDNKVTQDKLIIGVMDDKNINEYKEYINENKILQSSYEFSMIASDYDGIGDPFEYTLMNIENGLKNNKYDMLIGVDEDYLLPLIERNILYDLRDTLDKNNCNELILSFSKKHTEGSIYYIPSSIYNVKLLIINNDIFNELEIEIPTDQLTLKEFTDLCYLVDEKLHMCKKDNCFSVSLGSAVDEYLIDDINKLVLPLKDSQIKKELYIESYLTYAKLAKDLSYTRNDVGYQEPLDFTFLNGNIAMKLCTTYELYQFINYNPNFFDKDYRIKEFEYTILPIPYVNDDVNYTNAEIK